MDMPLHLTADAMKILEAFLASDPKSIISMSDVDDVLEELLNPELRRSPVSFWRRLIEDLEYVFTRLCFIPSSIMVNYVHSFMFLHSFMSSLAQRLVSAESRVCQNIQVATDGIQHKNKFQNSNSNFKDT